MKPEDLHPTRAALHDDDGCSAFQPGRRRWWWSVPTQQPPPPGGYNPRPLSRRERERRYKERWPERRRLSGKRPRRAESGRTCAICHTPINGAYSQYCQSCAGRLRYDERRTNKARQELGQIYKGGRSRGHEQRVKQLQAIQKALPL